MQRVLLANGAKGLRLSLKDATRSMNDWHFSNGYQSYLSSNNRYHKQVCRVIEQDMGNIIFSGRRLRASEHGLRQLALVASRRSRLREEHPQILEDVRISYIHANKPTGVFWPNRALGTPPTCNFCLKVALCHRGAAIQLLGSGRCLVVTNPPSQSRPRPCMPRRRFSTICPRRGLRWLRNPCIYPREPFSSLDGKSHCQCLSSFILDHVSPLFM